MTISPNSMTNVKKEQKVIEIYVRLETGTRHGGQWDTSVQYYVELGKSLINILV